MSYKLHHYLSSAPYRKLPCQYSDFSTLCAEIAPQTLPHVIGIDGPTTAGKTTFTAAIANFYRASGVPVAILGLDSFVFSRDRRAAVLDPIARKEMDIADYSEATRDQPGYRRCLTAARHILHATVQSSLHVPNSYNRLTGNNDMQLDIPVSPGGVLLTEGIGVHSYCADLLDTAIRLDIGDDTAAVGRIFSRERQKPASVQHLPDDFLEWRYDNVDGPHAIYHRELSAGLADVVIDTSQFNNLIVYTKTNF